MFLKIFSFFLISSFFMLQGCASSGVSGNPGLADPAAVDTFVLSSGDRLRITIFGDDDLSGEYDIGAGGLITMPLIGDVEAQGLSVEEFQSSITEKLNEGYLNNPRISIDVVSLRPFYILGEVRNPGSYPAFPELDVFKALATAGGLTPRAVKGRYIIYRGFGEKRVSFEAGDDTPVLPGDSIRVKERFF